MMRLFLFLGAAFAGLSVAFGAFASHAIKNQLSDRALAVFETGVRYQMYHAFGLLVVALLFQQLGEQSTLLTTAGGAFITGILIFSGSLYALSLLQIGWLGIITPLGGIAFLIGWGCLAIAAIRG